MKKRKEASDREIDSGNNLNCVLKTILDLNDLKDAQHKLTWIPNSVLILNAESVFFFLNNEPIHPDLMPDIQ